MPLSNGCVYGVVFFGKNTMFILEISSCRLAGSHGASSMKSIIFRCFSCKRRFKNSKMFVIVLNSSKLSGLQNNDICKDG